MFSSKDKLPAAAPLGSLPEGSLIIIQLQVADTALAETKAITRHNNINITLDLFTLSLLFT